MAEKLFDSIIVEREGHALTVMVQYEKYPQFCAHCITLGHSIQLCFKMIADTSVTGYKNVNKVGNKAQQLSDTDTIKRSEWNVSKVNVVLAPKHNEAVGKKPSNICITTDMHKVQSNAIQDLKEGQISAKDNTNTDYEIINVGTQILGTAQKNGENLTLHNTFELLESDTEQGIREDTPNDKESTPISTNIKDPSK